MNTIICGLFQGRPFVLMDETLERPQGFASVDAAREWLDEKYMTNSYWHACENIYFIDLTIGWTEDYL